MTGNNQPNQSTMPSLSDTTEIDINYEHLRAWYLARLRKAAIDESATLTPHRLVKADKEAVKSMLAQKASDDQQEAKLEQGTGNLLSVLFVAWMGGVAAIMLSLVMLGHADAGPAAVAVVLSVIWAVAIGVMYRKSIFDSLSVLTNKARRKVATTFSSSFSVSDDPMVQLNYMINAMCEKLTESDEREVAIFDFAPDMVCSLRPDGSFVSVNPASFRLLQYFPGELQKTNFTEYVLPDDLNKTIDSLRSSREKRQLVTFDCRMRSKNNIPVDMLWSCEWSETEGSYFLVGRDITSDKNLERLRREYVAMVSHDLRTPLTSIFAQLRLLSSGQLGDLSEKARRSTLMAERNASRLIELVSDILDVEKLESGKMELAPESLPLDPIIEQAVQTIKPFADQQKVSIEAPLTGLVVVADSKRLLQVLINLLSNAVKFSPEGEMISITVEERPSLVNVRISDHGPGISPQYKDSVFERFCQAAPTPKTSTKSTGLGLTICRGIVHKLGGTIGVDTEVGKGSTFWFTLPAGPRQPSH